MGFRLDTLKPALLWYGGVTVFFTIFMLIASHYHWLRVSAYLLEPSSQNSLLLYYFFIVSTSQEFIFRGLLFAEMKRIGIRSMWVQVLISGVLFALVHIHYRDGLTVMMTLGMGLIWGWLYTRYPNWLVISLSHGILGCVALLTHIV
jgi:membrane protease YdiL (CAAX protease family)